LVPAGLIACPLFNADSSPVRRRISLSRDNFYITDFISKRRRNKM